MITIAGGVYAERCIEPHWDDVYGSAGRAAAAMSGVLSDVKLVTFRAEDLRDGIDNLEAAYGITITGPEVPRGIAFSYTHSLSTPVIEPRPDNIEQRGSLDATDEVVLRFGMMEGSARVTASIAVYDPQSAFDPRPFGENGSRAGRLAIVLNRDEGRRLTGSDVPGEIASMLLREGTDVVALKMGSQGVLVATPDGTSAIPAYKSDQIWKIGSGDVYSAAFALNWAIEGRSPADAADLASRATSAYCANRALPIGSASTLAGLPLVPVRPGTGRIYLAAPFFNLAERWLVEEIRNQLLQIGVGVFSPLHDVGPGPGAVVAPLDLAGIDACHAVLAVLNGNDAGTNFEVGYAIARGMPVVALAQNVRPEDVKMSAGSGCKMVGDLASAVYHAAWALP